MPIGFDPRFAPASTIDSLLGLAPRRNLSALFGPQSAPAGFYPDMPAGLYPEAPDFMGPRGPHEGWQSRPQYSMPPESMIGPVPSRRIGDSMTAQLIGPGPAWDPFAMDNRTAPLVGPYRPLNPLAMDARYASLYRPPTYDPLGMDARTATLVNRPDIRREPPRMNDLSNKLAFMPPRPTIGSRSAKEIDPGMFVAPVSQWGPAPKPQPRAAKPANQPKPAASKIQPWEAAGYTGAMPWGNIDITSPQMTDEMLQRYVNSMGRSPSSSYVIAEGQNDQTRALLAEYERRFSPSLEINSPMGHVWNVPYAFWGEVSRNLFPAIGNAWGAFWNQKPEAHYMGEHMEGVAPFPATNAPTKSGAPAQTTKPAGATAGSRASTGGGGVGGGATAAGVAGGGAPMAGGIGVGNVDINELWKTIAANRETLNKKYADEESGYAQQADDAFKAMNDIANGPAPSIDSTNQMYTMLAANIAKVLNPNLDTPGQAQQLMAQKLEGMREKNRQQYLIMSEKYRRASELFDKRGDTKRAMEMAANSDDLINRANMLLSETHATRAEELQRQDMQLKREQIGEARAMQLRNERRQNMELNTQSLRAMVDQARQNYQNEKDDKRKKEALRTMTRAMRLLDKATQFQLASFNNPDGATTIDPDELVSEIFTTLDSSQYPQNEQALNKLFKHHKSFKEDALRQRWGVTEDEVRAWYRRHHGTGQ
jgi:hypothetical protein